MANSLSKNARPPQNQLRTMLQGDDFKQQVAMSLPDHLTPERFIRVSATCLSRVPRLAECEPTSFFKCLLDLSSMGLEPDGRRAHLIPFRNNKTQATECQLIIDYKGLVELVRRSGEVSDIHADVVCEHDDFEYGFGSNSQLVHKPNLNDRGKVIGAYSYVKMKNGSESFEVLSKSEVDSIRKRSKAANNGPWQTDYMEMAKKTAFRRHSKWLPISVELRDSIEQDDTQFAFSDTAKAKRARVSEVSSILDGPLTNGTDESATSEDSSDSETHDKSIALLDQAQKVLVSKRKEETLHDAYQEWQFNLTDQLEGSQRDAALRQLADVYEECLGKLKTSGTADTQGELY